MTNVISIAVLLAMSAISQTNAECCQPAAIIYHVCMGIPSEEEIPLQFPRLPILEVIDENDYWVRNQYDEYQLKCMSILCGDGNKIPDALFRHCGNGECNIFGCNCDGGCRSKDNVTAESIVNDFVEANGLKYQAKYKIDLSKLG